MTDELHRCSGAPDCASEGCLYFNPHDCKEQGCSGSACKVVNGPARCVPVEPEPELWICPKAETCEECTTHRVPHEYRLCSCGCDLSHLGCPACVPCEQPEPAPLDLDAHERLCQLRKAYNGLIDEMAKVIGERNEANEKLRLVRLAYDDAMREVFKLQADRVAADHAGRAMERLRNRMIEQRDEAEAERDNARDELRESAKLADEMGDAKQQIKNWRDIANGRAVTINVMRQQRDDTRDELDELRECFNSAWAMAQDLQRTK